MRRAMTHAHHPDLRVGNSLEQFIARFQLIGINGKLSGFNVDGRELALISRLELGTDFFLVEGIATAGELLFAIAAFGGGHAFAPEIAIGSRPMARRELYSVRFRIAKPSLFFNAEPVSQNLLKRLVTRWPPGTSLHHHSKYAVHYFLLA
jgi:hypothetical protein